MSKLENDTSEYLITWPMLLYFVYETFYKFEDKIFILEGMKCVCPQKFLKISKALMHTIAKKLKSCWLESNPSILRGSIGKLSEP